MATRATDLPRSSAARLGPPVGLAAAAGIGALALHLRDPHVSGSWGLCPYYALTGGYCPGCGGLRAAYDLTHLDLVGAASSNLLLVAALPLVAGFWLLWLRSAATARPRPRVPGTRPVVVTIVAVAVAFTVLRNLPAGAWLAP